MEKSFHISDLLSITTDKMVSTRNMEGVYDILEFIYGRTFFTHEIPGLMPKASGYILSQLPYLKNVSADNVTPSNIDEFISEQVLLHGEYHLIKPM